MFPDILTALYSYSKPHTRRMLAGELKPHVSEMTALSATWPKVLSLLLMVFKFGLKQNPLGYLLSLNFSLPSLTQLVSGSWSLHCTLSPPCPVSPLDGILESPNRWLSAPRIT